MAEGLLVGGVLEVAVGDLVADCAEEPDVELLRAVALAGDEVGIGEGPVRREGLAAELGPDVPVLKAAEDADCIL